MRSNDRRPRRSGALRSSLAAASDRPPIRPPCSRPGRRGRRGRRGFEPTSDWWPGVWPGVARTLMSSDTVWSPCDLLDSATRRSRSIRGSCGRSCGRSPIRPAGRRSGCPGRRRSGRRDRHEGGNWRRRRSRLDPHRLLARRRRRGPVCGWYRSSSSAFPNPKPVSKSRTTGGVPDEIGNHHAAGARADPPSGNERRSPARAGSISGATSAQSQSAIAARPQEAVAERAGFEPATGCPEPHFQCGAIVH